MQQRLLDGGPDEIQEVLVQDRRGRLSHGLSGRERVHAWTFTIGLLAFAVLLPLVAESDRPFTWGALIAVGVVYVVSTGIEFEVGSGSAVPAELALVPALFLLPAPLVPLTVAAALLIGDLPAFVRGRLHLERAATTVAYAWYSVPPAIVVLVAGEPEPGVGSLPLLGAILVAQFAGDLVSTLLGQRIARGVSARELVRPMAWVFLVDCLLAPIGLLAAIVAADVGSAAVLLVLPLMLLIVVFARERTARISNVLELSTAYRGTALLLGDVIEADDSYTGSHSRDVVDLTCAVCDEMGVPPRTRQQAELAALLHDVGKIAIPNEIITKPGKLTPEERELIETHTVEGQRLLHRVGGALSEIGDIVRACHERWDGKGYPDGTVGEEAPLVARIVACCDAFNAMTTDRSYRKALPLPVAIEELERNSGTQFDPAVVTALIRCIRSGAVDEVVGSLRPAA
jgi:HD-GYP domain-containing protein (c-di-GMP phosphodiesterase class II)